MERTDWNYDAREIPMQPPGWAVEDAKNELASDAPWEEVSARAWEITHTESNLHDVARIVGSFVAEALREALAESAMVDGRSAFEIDSGESLLIEIGPGGDATHVEWAPIARAIA